MTSPAANKRRGAKWETDLVKDFRAEGYTAERLRLNGSEDEGDLVVDDTVDDWGLTVIEAKSGAPKLSHWDEAEVEVRNYAKNRGLNPKDIDRVVVYRRQGKPGLRNALVLTSAARYFGLDDE